MSQRLRWALAGALAATVVGGGVAFATTQVVAGDGTIRACAQKNNGQLRLSDDGTCRPSEVSVEWPRTAGVTALDELAGSPCSLQGKAGALYFATGNGANSFAYVADCLTPDGAEPNDTQEAAKPLTRWITNTGTIYPAGDSDWFSVPPEVQSVGVYASYGIPPDGTPMTAELYCDGVLKQHGEVGASTSIAMPFFPFGQCLLHLTSTAVQLYNVNAN